MDLRRLRAGEWLAALGGVALLVSLFLPWYAGAGERGINAWEALAVLDVVLSLVAAAGLALLVLTAMQRVPAVLVALAAVVALLGAVAVVLIAVRAAWLPDAADGRDWALWLGLAGAAAIAAGGWLAIRDERVSRPGRTIDANGGPGPPPEARPLPSPRP